MMEKVEPIGPQYFHSYVEQRDECLRLLRYSDVELGLIYRRELNRAVEDLGDLIVGNVVSIEEARARLEK